MATIFDSNKYLDKAEWRTAVDPAFTHYERLGFEFGDRFSPAEINEAFQKRYNWWSEKDKISKSGKAHPTVKIVGPYIPDAVKNLSQAKDTLSDQNKKMEYDKRLKEESNKKIEEKFKVYIDFTLKDKVLTQDEKKNLLNEADTLEINRTRAEEIIVSEMKKAGATYQREVVEGEETARDNSGNQNNKTAVHWVITLLSWIFIGVIGLLIFINFWPSPITHVIQQPSQTPQTKSQSKKRAVSDTPKGHNSSTSVVAQQNSQKTQTETQSKESTAVEWHNKGVSLAKAGDLKEAIAAFNKVIEIDPNHPKDYYNIGLAYSKLGNYAQAISNYKKAIEIVPDNANYYINLGVAYYELGNYQEALGNLDIAIKIDPNDAEVFYGRGNLYNKLGKFQEAINDYDKAIKINPQIASAYMGRGLAFKKLGDEVRQVNDYRMAAKLGNKEAQEVLKNWKIEW